MSALEILLIILIFIITYLMVEISKVKKRLVRLIQENAVIWKVIKEQVGK
jgi:hypothetical protein